MAQSCSCISWCLQTQFTAGGKTTRNFWEEFWKWGRCRKAGKNKLSTHPWLILKLHMQVGHTRDPSENWKPGEHWASAMPLRPLSDRGWKSYWNVMSVYITGWPWTLQKSQAIKHWVNTLGLYTAGHTDIAA